MSTVTQDDVRHVAQLANLELTPEEEPRFAHDLNAILAYVAELATLDTTGIEPMAQVADLLPPSGAVHADEGYGATLRQDAIHPSLDRRSVMISAPETDGRFFKVPKVIER